MMLTRPEILTLEGKSRVRDLSPSTRSTCGSVDELDVSAASTFCEESKETSVASHRKDFCLAHLPINLKVKNTFLVMVDDASGEPAARRRAISAPARVLGANVEHESPLVPAGSPRAPHIAASSEQKVHEPTAMQQWLPQEELMKMNAAALYKQAQNARLAAAALRARAATQHQMATAAAANDGSSPEQMMWVLVPTACAPQQSLPQVGMEKMEAQRAHLGAAALRAMARLEAAESAKKCVEKWSRTDLAAYIQRHRNIAVMQ